MVYTNHHTDSVLIESTDPHGFIDNKMEMTATLEAYQTPAQDVVSHTFDTVAIQQYIDLKQLAGLSYFNQAIDLYNHHQLGKAIHYLDQASILYPAERMKVLRTIIYQAAQQVSMVSQQ